MKLSEYKNEEAIELLADIIEPVGEILSDEKVKNAFRTMPKHKVVSFVLKKYPKEIVSILARVEGVPEDKYEGNIATMMKEVMDIINDEVFSDFFSSQMPKRE